MSSRAHRPVRLVLASTLLIALSLAASVWSQQEVAARVTILPSERLTRTTGAPDEFTRTIAVPPWVVGPFVLDIRNGAPDGRGRLSSAWVSVDGKEIVRPSDFNQQVEVVTRTLALGAASVLSVRLAGSPGGFVTVGITGANGDRTAPAVTFIEPQAPSVNTRTTPVIVRYADPSGPGEAGASGVATETLRVIIDGVDRTSAFARDAAQATAAVVLTDGVHRIDARIADVAGNAAAVSTSVIVDATPPVVVSTSPAPGAAAVDVEVSVLATFSEPLAPESVAAGAFTLRDGEGQLVPASIAYDAESAIATLDPAAPLDGSTTYTATLAGGGAGPRVTDAIGNALGSSYTWSFTTVDLIPLSVVASSPAADARFVALDGGLQVTFSKAIDPASLTADSIQLRDTRDLPVEGSITYDAATYVAKFTPAQPLLPTRRYTATIGGGSSGARVRDVSGRALPQSHIWSFITTVAHRRIAAGGSHSVAVDDAGRVWTWGADSSGQRGTDFDGRSPGAVAQAQGIASVAAGGSHTLVLKSDGTVLAWGSNSWGQLGIGSTTSQVVPVPVPGLANVVAVAAGGLHSVALTSDGSVWTWGYGPYVGDGGSTHRLVPTRGNGMTNVIAIAAGSSHSLALMADGTVWGWGDNSFAQVGDGTQTLRRSPVRVTGLTGVVGITAGAMHSLAIAGDLSLWAWGTNSSGQLGDGTSTLRLSPVPVPGLGDIASIEAGSNRTIAVLLDGAVRAWGAGVSAGGGNSLVPIPAVGLPPVWQASAGQGHQLAVTRDGVVWAWSQNESGQLGDGTTLARAVPVSISEPGYLWKVGTPILSVAGGTYTSSFNVTISVTTPAATIRYTLDGRDPTESDPTIASGGSIPIAASVQLKARAWKAGYPASSIASAAYVFKAATPFLSPSEGTYTSPPSISISTATPGATLRYTIDGSEPTEASRLYIGAFKVFTTTVVKAAAFKAGFAPSDTRTGTFTLDFGTLAAPALTPAGGTYDSQVVVSLAAPSGTTIRYTTDGSAPTAASPIYGAPLTLATTTTIRARAFQTNYTTSAETSATYTIRIPPPSIGLASGTYVPGTRAAITSPDPAAAIHITLNGADPQPGDPQVPSGTVLLVGDFTLKARSFRAGATASTVATATYALTDALSAGAIAAGRAHTVVATPGGVVYAWGENASGQLGDGTTVNRTTPTLIPLTGVTAADAGDAHTLALTHDGRVWAWGYNGYGAVGDGSPASRSTPVPVAALTNVVAVAAGANHSLALTIHGDVYAWGLSDRGQLGLGATETQVVPVRVPGLTNVVAIAAGAAHSLAVTSTGQVYAWGDNAAVQLGDGVTLARTTPVLVDGLAGVVQVAAGGSHSLARLSTGDVYAWGENSRGQLGLGHTTNQSTPARVYGVTAKSIGAGSRHSTAIGSVLAWGDNEAGQLGDGTSDTRTTPTAVSGFDRAALMAAGDSHSVAVTPDGHLWTWGANGSGQLGDGTTTDRTLPQDVGALPGAWDAAPPPQVSLAPGTYGAVQTAVVWSPLPDATVRFTTNGATPTESDAVVPAGGAIPIAGTITLRLRAWAPGRPPSAVVTAAYILQPAPPAITPGTATYGAPQSVTVAAGDGTSVRYTLDGTEPVETSAIYTGPLAIDGFAVVKARAFRSGWTPSATASATLSFQLAAPMFSPPGGRHFSGQTIVLTADAGAQIRITQDGTEPTAASDLYAGPFQLPDDKFTLRARAFKAGWSASPIATATFTFSSDVTPPTISATVSPAPSADGWHTGPVTVTFACADPESAITFCSPPVQVTAEGEASETVGRAATSAGLGAAVTVRLNIDRTAPAVSVNSPSASELPAGTSAVIITGSAYDLGSGVEVVLCGAVPATVVGGQSYSCAVEVAPGVNTISISAVDRAGHIGTRDFTLDVGGATPAATALEISPARMTIGGGEARRIHVTDNRGRPVLDGVWTVDQPLIAEVRVADGEITVRGLASGEATLTVTRNGLTAQATVTIIAVDELSGLPAGTTVWSLVGTSPPKRGLVLRATPPDGPATSPAPSPDLYFIDEGTELFIGQPTRFWDRPTRIIATTADGRKLWERSFTDRIVKQFAADTDGGLVLVFAGQTMLGNIWSPASIQRLDGRTGGVRDEKRFNRHISEVSVHPDGTLYTTEDAVFGTSYLVEIPRSGTMIKHPLPKGHFRRYDSGPFAMEADADTPSEATQPIVLEDGTVVLVARARFTESYVISYDTGWYGPTWRVDYSQPGSSTGKMYLVTRRPGGVGISTDELDISAYLPTTPSAFAGFLPRDYRLLPDGRGGLLLMHQQAGWLTHVGADHVVTGQSATGFTAAGTRSEAVLGEDGLYVLTTGQVSSSGGPYYWATVQSRDPVTLDLLSEGSLGTATTETRHMGIRFALGGGGIYISGPTEAYAVNASVPTASFGAGGNATVLFDNDEWFGWQAGAPALAKGSPVSTAPSAWPYAQGSPYASNGAARDVTLAINTFIPEEWVDNPVEWITPGSTWFGSIFEGDNRRNLDINGSSRSKQRVVANAFGAISQTVAGWTRLYHKASSLDPVTQKLTAAARADTIVGDDRMLLAVARSSEQATASATSLQGGKMTITLGYAGNNPLANFGPANDITYQVTVNIDFAAMTYQLSGGHDGFPNYEIYINRRRVHHHEHGSYTPLDLDPGMEIVFAHPVAGIQP